MKHCAIPVAPALATATAAAAACLAACSPPPSAAWSGYAEGEYVYVAPAVAGTLSRLAVERGQPIAAGDLLFTLDATAEQAARDEAEARWQASQAQAADTGKGRRRDEIDVTEAQFAQARAAAALADTELARQTELLAQGFVSTAAVDNARSAAQQAGDRVREQGAALRVARLPARSDTQLAAAAEANAAKQALAQAAWRLGQRERRAGEAARVADTYYRPGEWVAAGQPVLALLPPAGRKARFFVPEAAVGALAVGQGVLLRCDGCGAAIPARVSFIATQAEYTPPVIYSNAQRAKLVFLVEARPDAAAAERLQPGQPLDVEPAGAVAKP